MPCCNPAPRGMRRKLPSASAGGTCSRVDEATKRRSPRVLLRFAASHGVERVAPDYQALVADPDVDIIYIGTITSLHKACGCSFYR